MTDTKPCKVCGKPFKPCTSETSGRYNWRRVACCPEHGAEYLNQILQSRMEKKSPVKEVTEDRTNNTYCKQKVISKNSNIRYESNKEK